MTDILSIAHRFGEDEKIMADDAAVCLRVWLKKAEEGKLISVALVGEQSDGNMISGRTVGARSYSFVGAIAALNSVLIEEINNSVTEAPE